MPRSPASRKRPRRSRCSTTRRRGRNTTALGLQGFKAEKRRTSATWAISSRPLGTFSATASSATCSAAGAPRPQRGRRAVPGRAGTQRGSHRRIEDHRVRAAFHAARRAAAQAQSPARGRKNAPTAAAAGAWCRPADSSRCNRPARRATAAAAWFASIVRAAAARDTCFAA